LSSPDPTTDSAGPRTGGHPVPIRTEGFDAIYEEHFPFVWRCLRHLGVPDMALDDAAQDVFVVVHRRIEGFEGSSTLRTWIFGIVRKVAFNHRRSAGRKAHVELLRTEPPSLSPGPLECAQDVQAAAFVQAFVNGLDEKKRDVFVLGILEEMNVPELAEALSIPLNTAYSRLRRVRADFRTALAKRR
jgi:RNA polymerase sigma-70 factor (ECF subfamily)